MKTEINFIFAWYDFWMGLFYDREKHRLYIFPLPTLGLRIQFYKTHKFFIDNKSFKHPRQFITGLEIRKYINAPVNYGIWLKKSSGGDMEVGDLQQIDLTKSEAKFFTSPRDITEG